MTRDDVLVVLCFLVVMLLGGCGAPLPVPRIYVDPSVPTEAVEQALKVWEPLGVTAEMASAPGYDVVTVTGSAETGCELDANGQLFTGATRAPPSGEGAIWIYVRMACYVDVSPAALIAHEIGHLFGLDHITHAPALMNAFFDDLSPPALTDADRAAFRDVWGTP